MPLSPSAPAPQDGELQKQNQELRSELKSLKDASDQRVKEENRVKAQFERQIKALQEELDIAVSCAHLSVR